MSGNDFGDADTETEVFLMRGGFLGKCTRCGEPSTGSFDASDKNTLKMRCVSCGYKVVLDTKGIALTLPVVDEG